MKMQRSSLGKYDIKIVGGQNTELEIANVLSFNYSIKSKKQRWLLLLPFNSTMLQVPTSHASIYACMIVLISEAVELS